MFFCLLNLINIFFSLIFLRIPFLIFFLPTRILEHLQRAQQIAIFSYFTEPSKKTRLQSTRYPARDFASSPSPSTNVASVSLAHQISPSKTSSLYPLLPATPEATNTQVSPFAKHFILPSLSCSIIILYLAPTPWPLNPSQCPPHSPQI